jgi:hypothetical protein
MAAVLDGSYCVGGMSFPFGEINVPPGVPVGQFGRLLMPIRIGARRKPWELNVSSSGLLEGASAVGFGVPVRLPDAESGGTPTPDGGFVCPLVDVPPCGAITEDGATSVGGGGNSGAAVGASAPAPGVDGCALAGAAKVTALTPTSTAIQARISRIRPRFSVRLRASAFFSGAPNEHTSS